MMIWIFVYLWPFEFQYFNLVSKISQKLFIKAIALKLDRLIGNDE